MVSLRRSILYLFFMTLFFPVLASAVVPGFFDTTFNSPNGFATYLTPFMYGERPNAVALQSDGKIVVVDTTSENSGEAQIAVIRYNPDGSLDRSFNGSGRVLYDNAFLSFATDIAIQTDGKIVVAGFRSQDAQNWYDIILLRYNPNGTLDSSFNSGEVVFINNVGFSGIDTIASLAIQEDGNILVATHNIASADNKNLLLLRYTPSGSLDMTFGIDGVVRYAYYEYGESEAVDFFSTENIVGRRVKIIPGGKIAVLIQAHPCTAILKYDQQGIFDSKSAPFCGQLTPQGYLTGALPRGMEVQPDGKIVVVGDTNISPFVVRYTSEGNLDPDFGEGTGAVYFNYRDHFGYSDNPVRSSSARNVAIQQDGSILMVGSCPMNHDVDILSDDVDVFLARYASDGTIDVSFGINGVVTFDGGWRDGTTYFGDLGQAVAVQPDGKIIVVGNTRAQAGVSGIHNDMVIMRFIGQPGPDIDVSPVNYDYGEVPKGGTKTQQFNISNIGQSDLAVTSIELIGGDSAFFNVDPGTCQNLTPIIVPGGSCFITILFVPGSEGLKASTLRITSNDPYARAISYGPVEVSLTGTGIAAESSYTLTVSTDGNGVGIVQSKPKGIKCGKNWADCTEPYAAGKEIILYRIIEQEESKFVGWSGACSGIKECKVVMDSHKEVKATFKADPTLVMWPKYRDFRNVKIGRMKAVFFVVKNSTKNGRKPLEVGPIELLQTPSPFQIFEDECSGMMLEPRESCVFGVLFEPEVAGAYTTEVKIPSNDPAAPVTAVQLSGNGVAPPPPKPPRKK
jgi:uncharacterized delta-60 repeat protein